MRAAAPDASSLFLLHAGSETSRLLSPRVRLFGAAISGVLRPRPLTSGPESRGVERADQSELIFSPEEHLTDPLGFDQLSACAHTLVLSLLMTGSDPPAAPHRR